MTSEELNIWPQCRILPIFSLKNTSKSYLMENIKKHDVLISDPLMSLVLARSQFAVVFYAIMWR